jgi:hypothetical protein
MAISEESRHHLYQRLEQVLGSEEAATLMEHLPPVGWADVATRRDIDELRVATKRDIDELRGATGREIEGLRRDIGHIEGRLNRMEGHLERFDSRFDNVRSDIHTTMLAVMSMMVVLFGAVVAVVKL